MNGFDPVCYKARDSKWQETLTPFPILWLLDKLDDTGQRSPLRPWGCHVCAKPRWTFAFIPSGCLFLEWSQGKDAGTSSPLGTFETLCTPAATLKVEFPWVRTVFFGSHFLVRVEFCVKTGRTLQL